LNEREGERKEEKGKKQTMKKRTTDKSNDGSMQRDDE
jgi:hypothetical protein